MSNIPYRGEVDHGVPHEPITGIDESAYWKDADETNYEDEAKAVEPIPVRVVNRGAREIKTFSSDVFVLAPGQPITTAVQVVGRDENRTSLEIYVQGGGTVYVAPTKDAFSSYLPTVIGLVIRGAMPVAVGGRITLSTTEPVWIGGNEDNPSVVYVSVERTEAVE